MVKLLGFIIILFSTVKIGFELSNKYTNRTKELRNLVNALEIICKELNFTTNNISDMFVSASKTNSKNINKLFGDMAHNIKNELITPLEAFNKCKTNVNFALNDEDLLVLADYCSVCGSGMVDDEIFSIKNAMRILNNNIELARVDENKYVKLYRFTGFVLGMMLVIILV